jgi:hypothetical protein
VHFSLFQAQNMFRPSHQPWSGRPNDIQRLVQIIRLVTKFSSVIFLLPTPS